MKTKFIKLMAGVLLAGMIMAGNALAEVNPWYVGINTDVVFSSDSDIGTLDDAIEYDTGYNFGVAVGRQLGNFRAELALDTSKSDMDNVLDLNVDGDVRVDTLMVNGYYTVPVSEDIGIFAMAGIGPAKLDVTNPAVDDSDTVFAAKVGLGLTYAMTTDWMLDVGYEYMETTDANIAGTTVSYSDSAIGIGVRYLF